MIKFYIVAAIIMFVRQAPAEIFTRGELAEARRTIQIFDGSVECKLKELLGDKTVRALKISGQSWSVEPSGNDDALFITGFTPGLGGLSGGAAWLAPNQAWITYLDEGKLLSFTTEAASATAPKKLWSGRRDLINRGPCRLTSVSILGGSVFVRKKLKPVVQKRARRFGQVFSTARRTSEADQLI